MPLSVVLVDRNRLTLEGVRRALEVCEHIDVVGQATGAMDALAILKRERPAVLLLDPDLPDMEGTAFLELIRINYKNVKVIVLSDECDVEKIAAALDAGVTAYVLKTVDPSDLAATIRQAAAGTVFTAVAAPRPKAAPDCVATGLTDRERNVLDAIARGMSSKAIGQQLWVTEQTVKFDLNNIYRKLGVSNRTSAARYAYQQGLVDGAI